MAEKQKYKVIDPDGVTGFNGRKYACGDIVESEPDAHVKAWLRFGQVKTATAADLKTKIPAEPKASAETKPEEAAQ